MKPSPYVVGQWVRGERFYGRAGEIAEILEGPRHALWLLGTRRVGKTSLLKQLEHLAATQPERGFFPLFWDFQGAESASELHLGFADALQDAEERLEEAGLDLNELEDEDLFVSLGRLRRGLRKLDRRLLLLCDEAEELLGLQRQEPALLRKLRRAMQAGDEIRAVLASTIKLWALLEEATDTSPFLHGFTPPLYLGPLADREADQLIGQQNLPPGARPEIGEEDAEALRLRCGNHPFLLQLVCKRFVESGDLETAVEQVVADRMVSYFFAVDFEMLSPVDRSILTLAARRSAVASNTLGEALEVSGDSLSGALANLAELGFLRRGEAGRYELANDFFRRWLLEAPRESPEATPMEEVGSRDATLLQGSEEGLLDRRYELRREVGSGATGSVYEAYDRLLRSKIAVKLLRAEYAGNRAVLERYRKEILLSRDLAHPNIVRVYHLGESGGRTYLTMQWVDGPTLADRIREAAPLAREEIAAIGSGLASALEAAHQRRVLHRDIKPQNVLMQPSGRPLMADFGLARLLGGAGISSHGLFVGTPRYASPEQARLEPLDERSDLYSLGVVLFEMATGRCPFEGETIADVLEQHRSQPPPDPREIAEGVGPELAEIILRCLAKEPGQRFPDAAALGAALGELAPAGDAREPVTTAIAELVEGGPGSPTAEELLPLVYDEMRRMARAFLSRERPDHTLQPTALVHEAYLKLVDQSRVDWQGRTHFLAVGAKAMRRLLVDHARKKTSLKRGGRQATVTLIEGLVPGRGGELGEEELLSLDDALRRLESVSERQARVVELRFFGGLTVKEAAAHLGVSERTVESDWTAAREWLRRELGDGGNDPL